MGAGFIINAYSSHAGGGRTGLLDLMNALPAGEPVLLFADKRMKFPGTLPANVTIVPVAPTFLGRLAAEWKIRKAARSYSWLLRLGSLPPFFRLPIPSFVYFENRHLLRGEPIAGMPLRRKFRVHFERFLVRLLSGNATCFVVQTSSVEEGLRRTLGDSVKIMVNPFRERPHRADISTPKFDFIYVSSPDAHKNHRNLIDAWCWLAQRTVRPTLAVTIPEGANPELSRYLAEKCEEYKLHVTNLGHLSSEEVLKNLALSKAAIYPSTCESFGLPIVEAMGMGLPVLASELDYVRDLLDPVQTFDPMSAKSIGRAVLRHLQVADMKTVPLSPCEFLDVMKKAL